MEKNRRDLLEKQASLARKVTIQLFLYIRVFWSSGYFEISTLSQHMDFDLLLPTDRGLNSPVCWPGFTSRKSPLRDICTVPCSRRLMQEEMILPYHQNGPVSFLWPVFGFHELTPLQSSFWHLVLPCYWHWSPGWLEGCYYR